MSLTVRHLLRCLSLMRPLWIFTPEICEEIPQAIGHRLTAEQLLGSFRYAFCHGKTKSVRRADLIQKFCHTRDGVIKRSSNAAHGKDAKVAVCRHDWNPECTSLQKYVRESFILTRAGA